MPGFMKQKLQIDFPLVQVKCVNYETSIVSIWRNVIQEENYVFFFSKILQDNMQ